MHSYASYNWVELHICMHLGILFFRSYNLCCYKNADLIDCNSKMHIKDCNQPKPIAVQPNSELVNSLTTPFGSPVSRGTETPEHLRSARTTRLKFTRKAS